MLFSPKEIEHLKITGIITSTGVRVDGEDSVFGNVSCKGKIYVKHLYGILEPATDKHYYIIAFKNIVIEEHDFAHAVKIYNEVEFMNESKARASCF